MSFRNYLWLDGCTHQDSYLPPSPLKKSSKSAFGLQNATDAMTDYDGNYDGLGDMW